MYCHAFANQMLNLFRSMFLLSGIPLFLLQSFGRISKWLDHAKSSPNLTVIAGGNCDNSKGYFVEPTIIETKDPQDTIMNEVWR